MYVTIEVHHVSKGLVTRLHVRVPAEALPNVVESRVRKDYDSYIKNAKLDATKHYWQWPQGGNDETE